MGKIEKDLRTTSIPNEAPPGLFFTKAAFFRYSALSRVKAARAARNRGPPSLPKPLGPLSGTLTRAGKAKAKDKDKAKANPESQDRDALGNHTQDAVVPELQATDEGASEEIASEDIWGEDENDDIFSESAGPTAESAPVKAPVGKPRKHVARIGTKKRAAPAAANGMAAAKRPRKQPKKATGQADGAGTKVAVRSGPSCTKGNKVQRGSRVSKGAGSAYAEVAEPGEDTLSEVQAARAQFMRTMGLPEPRAFSSSSKSASRGSAQRRPHQSLSSPSLRQTAGRLPDSASTASLASKQQLQSPQQQQQSLTAAKLNKQPAADAKTPQGMPEHQASLLMSSLPAPGGAVQEVPTQAKEHPGGTMHKSASTLKASPERAGHPMQGINSAGTEKHHLQASRIALPMPQQVLQADAVEAEAGSKSEVAAVASAAAQAPGGSPPHPPQQPPKVAQPFAGSGRPAQNGVKLVNLLNPNNPQYDQAFALEYALMKAAAGKDGGKGHKKRGPRRIYSTLTAQEHAWYLTKQGLPLHGRVAERMADLSEKVTQEQQQYIRAQWADAQDAERFRYMDPRVEAQVQAHFRPQREAVRQLPRLWQLRNRLQLAELLQGSEQAPAMAHLSTPISLGQPAPFTPPPGHTAVPLDRTYLSSEGCDAAVPQLAHDAAALRLASEKRAAAIVSDGAFCALAQAAVQGAAAGWEIPLSVLPTSGTSSSQSVLQPGAVVLGKPLLKRALSRREKHEVLFGAAVLALGCDRALKQQPAQPGDWRKQLLDAMGGPTGGAQSPAERGDASAVRPLASGRSGAATDGTSVPGAERRPSEQPAVRYSLWRMGEHRIITRAQVHAALQSNPAGEHSAHSMHSMAAHVQAKAEYHGNKASDAEELTPEELVRWWSAAHVRPGAHVVVGHVGVHSCQLVKCQHFTAGELLEAAAGAGFHPAMMWRLMSALLGQLTGLPAGQYLLTHQPGAEAICLFAADCQEEQQRAEADVAPLPCMTDAKPGAVFDLWSAHAHSGATDESQLGFTPKMWQPSFPDVPQIPYTFTPRQPQPSSGKRRGRKGNAKQAAAAEAGATIWVPRMRRGHPDGPVLPVHLQPADDEFTMDFYTTAAGCGHRAFRNDPRMCLITIYGDSTKGLASENPMEHSPIMEEGSVIIKPNIFERLGRRGRTWAAPVGIVGERDEPIAAHQNAPYDTETYPVTLIDRKEYANGITLSALILLSMPQTEILQRAITVHGDKVGAYAQQTNRALRVRRPSQLTQVGSAKP